MKIKSILGTILLSCALVIGITCPSLITPVYALQSTPESVNAFLEEIYLTNQAEVQNRAAGSTGEKAMATRLSSYVQTAGFNFMDGQTSFTQTFDISSTKQSQNIIAQSGTASEKYVILGAHYDSVYVENKSHGYNDNLSGILAVMETAKIVASSEKFNIIIAFWGAEEVGHRGSKYFVNTLPDAIKNNILLYINFDTVGAGDYRYYYTNDFQTPYARAVDSAFSGQPIQKYNNQRFSPHTTSGVNYTNLPLNSDNLSFITAGINSLNFFTGNLDAPNGFGYFETAGHDRIMHTTDSKETIEDVFGATHFAENISAFANLTAILLQSENFTESAFTPSQINPSLFSDVTLKICGVCLVVSGFTVYLLVYFLKYKKNKNK